MQFDKIDYQFIVLILHASLDSREEMFFTGTTGTPEQSCYADLRSTTALEWVPGTMIGFDQSDTVIPIHKRVLTRDSPVSKPRVRVYYGTAPGRLPGTQRFRLVQRERIPSKGRSVAR